MLTIDWGFPWQDHHYELEVGSVLLQLSEQRLHIVHTRDITLEEWLLRDGHASVITDTTKLVNKLPTYTCMRVQRVSNFTSSTTCVIVPNVST